MAIIIDVVAVLLFLFFLWRGKRRGFIKTFAGILALILAFWGAGVLADYTAPAISEKYVTPWVSDFIAPKVEAENPETPTEFEALLIEIGVPEGMASDLITARPVAELAENASVTLSEKLTYAILCLVYFILLLLVLKLLFRVVDKIFDLPVLNFANSTLGLICGGIFGFLFIYLLMTIMLKTNFILNEQLISETYVLRTIAELNPFKL